MNITSFLISLPSQIKFFLFLSFSRVKGQAQFPNYSKNHVHLFMHACYWDKQAARKAMEKYGEIRAAAPELFADRDPMLPSIQHVFNIT